MDESSSCHVVSYDLRRREIQKKKKTRKANNESETKPKFKKKYNKQLRGKARKRTSCNNIFKK